MSTGKSDTVLLTNHGLSSDDLSNAQVFQARFFSNQPPNVPEVFPDDIPALEARDFSPITHEEITSTHTPWAPTPRALR
jgi:hypothetical protein